MEEVNIPLGGLQYWLPLGLIVEKTPVRPLKSHDFAVGCRLINLQIFTEISRFFYLSLQICGVLRLRGRIPVVIWLTIYI